MAAVALLLAMTATGRARAATPQVPDDARTPAAAEARQQRLQRSGANDCTDLPAPPAGVPGLREYARLTVPRDGVLEVTAAQLPFSNNPGYVYRQVAGGWEPNEIDYILLRSPVPLRGGFVYLLTFGGDEDRCGPWSLDVSYPE